MDLAALRQRVRDLTGYLVPEVLPDALVNAFVNDSYLEFCSLESWPFRRVEITIPTVADTQTYTITPPAGFDAVRNIADLAITAGDDRGLVTARQLTEMADLPAAEQDDEDAPQFYTFDGTTITVWPIPDAVYTMRLRGWGQPAVLTESDEPIFASEYHPAVAYAAAARVLQREAEGSGRDQMFQNEANAAYDRMKRDYLVDHDEQLVTMGGRRDRIRPSQAGWRYWS